MKGKELSPEEINKRLVRLRNLERLYAELKIKYGKLKEENQALKEQVSLLTQVIEEQQESITDLTLQVNELRTIVFGKKRKKKDGNDDDLTPSSGKSSKRSKDSYKRPLPKEEDITGREHHSVSECPCGSKLIKKETVVYYEEDIPLPVKKTIIKHSVEKGYCKTCKKWHPAIPLPSHKVIIGKKARKLIAILSIVNLSSFSQIETLLKDIFNFNVSQGEIANILAKEAGYLSPIYERLKEKIRGAPVKCLDETSWKVFKDDSSGDYAWVMADPLTSESLFLLGKNRGKGNIETLLGKDHKGVTVSDDYGAYNSLKKKGKHQLCFAHPHRKLRDLDSLEGLKKKEMLAYEKTYQKFSGIYGELREDRDIKKYDKYSERLTELSIIGKNDPRKLIRIKKSIKKNISSYLTCLSDKRIPLDNNQAERALRHLVLKRKVSFGSLNKKTANNLSILFSVILSLKQKNKDNFFEEYLRGVRGYFYW